MADGYWTFNRSGSRPNEKVLAGDLPELPLRFSPNGDGGSFASGGLSADRRYYVKYYDRDEKCDPAEEFNCLVALNGLTDCPVGNTPIAYYLGRCQPPSGASIKAILMEPACGATIKTVVEESLLADSLGSLPSSDKVLVVANSLAQAYRAVHKTTVMAHRDASSENVFIDYDDPSLSVTLIDFGNAVEKNSTLTFTRYAAPHFGAPEVFIGGNLYARRAPEQDTWSIGALLYYLRTYLLPHHNEISEISISAPLADIAEAKRNPLDLLAQLDAPSKADIVLAEIIAGCTQYEKDDRIHLEDILSKTAPFRNVLDISAGQQNVGQEPSLNDLSDSDFMRHDDGLALSVKSGSLDECVEPPDFENPDFEELGWFDPKRDYWNDRTKLVSLDPETSIEECESFDIDSYNMFIACFMPREKAIELSRNDENMDRFRETGLAWSSLTLAIREGRVPASTTYEDYVLGLLQDPRYQLSEQYGKHDIAQALSLLSMQDYVNSAQHFIKAAGCKVQGTPTMADILSFIEKECYSQPACNGRSICANTYRDIGMLLESVGEIIMQSTEEVAKELFYLEIASRIAANEFDGFEDNKPGHYKTCVDLLIHTIDETIEADYFIGMIQIRLGMIFDKGRPGVKPNFFRSRMYFSRGRKNATHELGIASGKASADEMSVVKTVDGQEWLVLSEAMLDRKLYRFMVGFNSKEQLIDAGRIGVFRAYLSEGKQYTEGVSNDDEMRIALQRLVPNKPIDDSEKEIDLKQYLPTDVLRKYQRWKVR